MEKRLILIIALFIIAVFSILLIFNNKTKEDISGKITGKVVESVVEELKLSECSTSGWDGENNDYKLITCDDDKIMKGVGIAVTKDSVSGGRAYCCKSNVESYDCNEEGYWEVKDKDYEITKCSNGIMRGVGIKVEDNSQAGGKVYCCIGKGVELYECAYTNMWKDNSKDNELTVCPDDRPILVGAGFYVHDDDQEGGKVYCCKGKVKVEKVEEKAENTTKITEESEKVEVEEEKGGEEITETEPRKNAVYEFFCKIFYPKSWQEKCR